jgi:hypothetical protein
MFEIRAATTAELGDVLDPEALLLACAGSGRSG